MSQIINAKIMQNAPIAHNIYDMRLKAPGGINARAGQFLSIFTNNPKMLLPRPLSICEIDSDGSSLRIVYRIAGAGTKELATYTPGQELRILGPVGNHFEVDNNFEMDTNSPHKSFAIVGGGIGVPPLLELCKLIRGQLPDANIDVFLGFRSMGHVILEDDFRKYSDNLVISTDDGAYGTKGNAVEMMELAIKNMTLSVKNMTPAEKDSHKPFDMAYGCGPNVMLAGLYECAKKYDIPCFVSMEEHMACCVGACLACVVNFKEHGGGIAKKRVCADGPIFDAKELVWK